jgi:uncharacterized protein YkwD
MRFTTVLLCTLVSSFGTAVGTTTEESKSDEAFKLSPIEKSLLELTNDERAKQGAPPLQVNKRLFLAARSHSANMSNKGQLSHTLDGKGPGERLAEVGYKGFGWSENCAAGQQSVEEAIASWLSSPGHRANLLNADYKEIGLGIAGDGRGGFYFTQLFGVPSS